MKFDEFKKLSEDEQKKFAVKAYREEKIFNEVRAEFLKKYGNNPRIEQVLVDNYGMGDAPLVILTLNEGQGNLELPKEFMGFPIYRRYTKSGHKKYDHPQETQQ